MEKKEILKAFKQAEIDWIDYVKEYEYEYRLYGFCTYFLFELRINKQVSDKHLKPYWLKYATTPDGLWLFRGTQERLEAIRKVINELENE
jgi:hypothetical protein